MSYQRPPSPYLSGVLRVSMVTDDPYMEDSDSDMEDEFGSHHLQGFSRVVVNNTRRNGSHQRTRFRRSLFSDSR